MDKSAKRSVRLANALAKAEITVDVTPRCCQRFQVRPGRSIPWSLSTGQSGHVLADPAGLVTIPKVILRPAGETVLTLSVD